MLYVFNSEKKSISTHVGHKDNKVNRNLECVLLLHMCLLYGAAKKLHNIFQSILTRNNDMCYSFMDNFIQCFSAP